MTDAQEDFEKLRKLLKLKRYEQPPPGYFNHFSANVLNRIGTVDVQRHSRGNEIPWLQKLIAFLETNPMAAGAFGVAMCGLLISGIAYSQYREPIASTNAGNVTLTVADSSLADGAPSWSKPAGLDANASSISPVLGTNVDSLFNGKLDVQQASFSVTH